MKIRPHGSDLEIEVFCLYWSNNVRHYLSINVDKFEGADIYDESDADLIDTDIDNFTIRKGSDGFDILIHKALSDDDLLDKVVDWDEDAAQIFFNRLAHYK